MFRKVVDILLLAKNDVSCLLNFKEFSKHKYTIKISNYLNISSLYTFTKLFEVNGVLKYYFYFKMKFKKCKLLFCKI